MFFVFLLASPVKDLKDVEGDKIAGVNTLPVIFGELRARKIIGLLVCISYIATAIILPELLSQVVDLRVFLIIVAALGFGIFNFFYISRSNAKEKTIFSIYFLYVILILLALFVRNT